MKKKIIPVQTHNFKNFNFLFSSQHFLRKTRKLKNYIIIRKKTKHIFETLPDSKTFKSVSQSYQNFVKYSFNYPISYIYNP